MWKQIYDLISRVLTLTRDTQKNTSDIKEIRQELKEMSELIQRVIYQLSLMNERQNHVSEREQQEREKLKLWLENQLLRAGRKLPPGRPDPDDDSSE